MQGLSSVAGVQAPHGRELETGHRDPEPRPVLPAQACSRARRREELSQGEPFGAALWPRRSQIPAGCLAQLF